MSAISSARSGRINQIHARRSRRSGGSSLGNQSAESAFMPMVFTNSTSTHERRKSMSSSGWMSRYRTVEGVSWSSCWSVNDIRLRHTTGGFADAVRDRSVKRGKPSDSTNGENVEQPTRRPRRGQPDDGTEGIDRDQPKDSPTTNPRPCGKTMLRDRRPALPANHREKFRHDIVEMRAWRGQPHADGLYVSQMLP